MKGAFTVRPIMEGRRHRVIEGKTMYPAIMLHIGCGDITFETFLPNLAAERPVAAINEVLGRAGIASESLLSRTHLCTLYANEAADTLYIDFEQPLLEHDEMQQIAESMSAIFFMGIEEL